MRNLELIKVVDPDPRSAFAILTEIAANPLYNPNEFRRYIPRFQNKSKFLPTRSSMISISMQNKEKKILENKNNKNGNKIDIENEDENKNENDVIVSERYDYDRSDDACSGNDDDMYNNMNVITEKNGSQNNYDDNVGINRNNDNDDNDNYENNNDNNNNNNDDNNNNNNHNHNNNNDNNDNNNNCDIKMASDLMINSRDKNIHNKVKKKNETVETSSTSKVDTQLINLKESIDSGENNDVLKNGVLNSSAVIDIGKAVNDGDSKITDHIEEGRKKKLIILSSTNQHSDDVQHTSRRSKSTERSNEKGGEKGSEKDNDRHRSRSRLKLENNGDAEIGNESKREVEREHESESKIENVIRTENGDVNKNGNGNKKKKEKENVGIDMKGVQSIAKDIRVNLNIKDANQDTSLQEHEHHLAEEKLENEMVPEESNCEGEKIEEKKEEKKEDEEGEKEKDKKKSQEETVFRESKKEEHDKSTKITTDKIVRKEDKEQDEIENQKELKRIKTVYSNNVNNSNLPIFEENNNSVISTTRHMPTLITKNNIMEFDRSKLHNIFRRRDIRQNCQNKLESPLYDFSPIPSPEIGVRILDPDCTESGRVLSDSTQGVYV